MLGDAAFYDDFMKARPATPLSPAPGSYRYPHPMTVGDDDLLYIGDGPRLHAFDGSYASDDDGKFYDSVLKIPGTSNLLGLPKPPDSASPAAILLACPGLHASIRKVSCGGC